MFRVPNKSNFVSDPQMQLDYAKLRLPSFDMRLSMNAHHHIQYKD